MERIVLIYQVELTGKILSIDGPWDKFAKDNGATGLERERLICLNLFRFITAPGVVETYKTMHRYLNENPDKNLSFDYRCDSPEVRREMHMVMENMKGGVRYTSSVLATSPLHPPIVVDYRNESGEMVRMCSWCKRVKYPPDAENWNELDRLFEISPDSFGITHGICEDCRRKISYLKLGAGPF